MKELSVPSQKNSSGSGSMRFLESILKDRFSPKNCLTVLLSGSLLTGVGCTSWKGMQFPSRKLAARSLVQTPQVVAQAETTSTDVPNVAVVPVSYDAPVVGPDGINATVGYDQACVSDSCRMVDCQGECSECAPPSMVALPKNAQEYIFDGGDQQQTVVIRDDWSAAGVDPTDTVIFYETLAGQVCVTPSNRVPIYAPRFGAVRQVTGVVLAERAIGTERILAPIKPGRFDETDLAGTVMQPLAPHGEEQVKLIDAFQENAMGTPIAQVVPPSRMSEALVPFEGVEVLGTGRITDEEIAVLGRVLENARTWFTPESLDIVIDGQQVALLGESLNAQDVYVYEMPDKCAMRICKAASHTIANSGDIVSFTIRFDNSGVKPLGNAVIMDSLSPRLEYIEGSQQCSVDARFSAEPNEVGSQVLRWEIESPVEPSHGGVISFDCRVR